MMKILIANRGEIAVRIIRACQELGIRSVGVFTDVDKVALHVRFADEVYPLSDRRDYLNPKAILEAAKKSRAIAIHPGYGFLSENADFAREVEQAGLVFIGPTEDTIRLAGNKIAAKMMVRQLGVPVLDGSEGLLPREYSPSLTTNVRFPVLVKAAGGGGGRGIRLALTAEELPNMIDIARREARAAFGSDEVYLEELVQQARHIEVQIFGDGNGNVISLGDRECSIQRRRQKLIEEAPVSGIESALQQKINDAAILIAHQMQYRSLGTVEFLVDDADHFYFMEINPRLQVEHPTTEMVTGIDLVKEQIVLAMEKKIQFDQSSVQIKGKSMEARILAEDPWMNFQPSTGQITNLREAGGPGVRIDSALYSGMNVSSEYDSLLAKVIVWAEDRNSAINRLRRALREYQIAGISTDIPFLLQILDHPQFVDGKVTTNILDTIQPQNEMMENELLKEIAGITALLAHQKQKSTSNHHHRIASHWQMTAWREQNGRDW